MFAFQRGASDRVCVRGEHGRGGAGGAGAGLQILAEDADGQSVSSANCRLRKTSRRKTRDGHCWGGSASRASKMLPSGAVEIDGQMIDAMSQGQAVDPGQYVVVIEVRANRVLVRPAKAMSGPAAVSRPADMLNRSIEELGIESAGRSAGLDQLPKADL